MAPVILAGRYRLVRRIATGGMGTVHEGLDERLGRRVAVKVLKDEYASDPAFVERFTREARATAALVHPHIAQVYDSGRDGDHHFIVMQFVDGEHLGEVLRREGRLTPERATAIAGQVCSALAVAHAAGIVHRDIKPGNVMIRPDGQVLVTDFGIAQSLGQSTLTEAGSVLGTAKYLSPEQATGQRVTPASDVYSVGVLCFQMLTGVVPFDGDTPIAVAMSHIRDEIPDVRQLAPAVPGPLAAVVARATAKDPQQRYADGGEMERALGAAAAGAPEPATAVLPPPAKAEPTLPLPLPARRGRGVGVLPRLLVAGLVAAGLVAAGWAALDRDESPDSPAQPTAAGTTTAPTETTAQPTTAPPSTQAAEPEPEGDPDPEQEGDPDPQQEGEPDPQQEGDPDPQQEPGAVPEDAVGRGAKALEDELKAQGFSVQKVDIKASAPKDSVLATIPGPGEPLADGQQVVLIASDGERGNDQSEASTLAVPDGIVGTDVKDVRELLRESGVEVKTADVESAEPKGTVVATYPGAGTVTDVVVLVVSRGE